MWIVLTKTQEAAGLETIAVLDTEVETAAWDIDSMALKEFDWIEYAKLMLYMLSCELSLLYRGYFVIVKFRLLGTDCPAFILGVTM